MNFIISTENTCDLSSQYLNSNEIAVIKMSYFVSGVEYGADTDNEMDIKEFYNRMRNGETVSTSLVNKTRAYEYFSELLKSGKDIIHIAFASACSGSYDNFLEASKELNEKNENKIFVIDSACESAGQGLLVKLVQKFALTHTIKETYDYANDVKNRINLLFTVDDLKYLARGGRISKTSASIGSLLNIKPVLSVDEDGKLTARTKVITRRVSINRLVLKTKEKFTGEDEKIIIGHSDCREDAESVRDKLADISRDIEIEDIGPVIGAHSGPGTLAIFFVGRDRKF